jgi:hypothetical protein
MRLNERQIRTLIRKVIAEVARPKSIKEQSDVSWDWEIKPTPEFTAWVEKRKAMGKAAGVYVDDNGLVDGSDGQDDDDFNRELYQDPQQDDDSGEDFLPEREPYVNRRHKDLDDEGWQEEDPDAEEDEYFTDQLTGKILENDETKSDEGFILMKASRAGKGKVKKSDAYKSKVYKTKKEASAAAKELRKDNPVGFTVHKLGDDF